MNKNEKRKRWTHEEILRLQDEVERKGLSFGEIAKLHKRKEGAVRSEARLYRFKRIER